MLLNKGIERQNPARSEQFFRYDAFLFLVRSAFRALSSNDFFGRTAQAVQVSLNICRVFAFGLKRTRDTAGEVPKCLRLHEW